MATELAPTLVNDGIARTGLRWQRAVVAAGPILFVPLLGAAYVDGVLAGPFDGSFWRLALLPSAIVLYILVGYHLLIPLLKDAIDAFEPLVTIERETFQELVRCASTLDRRREWLSLGVGIVIGLPLAFRLWDGPVYAHWMKLHWLISDALAAGLGGWAIYASLVYARTITELHQQPMEIDVFDPTPLEPIARYGLGLSLTFLGGVTLMVLSVPDPQVLLRVEWIIMYGVTILVSILLFFLTMMHTHHVMEAVKERELRRVRHKIAAIYHQLHAQTGGEPENAEALSDSVTAWLAYEQRIEGAPDWPYTADTLRNLLMSTLLPIIAWAAQVVVDILT